MLQVGLLLISVGATALAADPKPDMSIFDPPTDGGRFVNLHDSETLLRGRWNVGFFLDYGHKPLTLRFTTVGPPVTSARFDVVASQLTGTFVGGIGITDWWGVGVGVPVTFWEKYYDPNVQFAAALAGTPGAGAQNKAGLGDLRVESKFQLLDIDKYNIGVAIIPHIFMPTGRKGTFISGERWTPGATLAVEGNIKDRTWLGLNLRYDYVKGAPQYFAGNPDAIVDDTLRIGLGARVKINDEWAALGEAVSETVGKNAWKLSTQSPTELSAGVQYTPQKNPAMRGFGFTMMGGGGVTRGVGAAQAHVVLGVTYPTPKIVKLEKPAPKVKIVDKIVITQMIHFAFNSSEIRAVSFPILDDVVSLLRDNPQIHLVQVEGHTDWIGSDEYNLRLSQRRAQSVVNYLVGKGIAGSRLSPKGFGEARPIADNNTDEGRARNRRTEFVVQN